MFQASGLLEVEQPIQWTQKGLHFPGKWVIHVIGVFSNNSLPMR
jgi:hypothetical protein